MTWSPELRGASGETGPIVENGRVFAYRVREAETRDKREDAKAQRGSEGLETGQVFGLDQNLLGVGLTAQIKTEIISPPSSRKRLF